MQADGRAGGRRDGVRQNRQLLTDRRRCRGNS
jgi:hypothetical protein